MSRVLLFVQTGDARPKCVKVFKGREADARAYFAKIKFGDPAQPERGWLVQCHKADWGRTCIEAAVAAVQYGPGPSVHFDFWDEMSKRHGRILASGGK